MQETISTPAPAKTGWLTNFTPRTRSRPLTLTDWGAAFLASVLLVLSFPDFDLWPLAWVALIPLLMVIARCASAGRAFMVGLTWGVCFFYGSCWWVTCSMIHYGHLRPFVAYPLLFLPVIFIALF